MTAKRILVVDDDEQIRSILRSLLEREGFEVAEARNGEELWEGLRVGLTSLVTLDLNLQGEDGLALARDVRSRLDVPIIMISGKSDDVDRIVGLELGADDYITKPFNLREVLARIRAVLRRYEPNHRPVSEAAPDRELLTFDGWSLDAASRVVTDPAGAAVDLTTAEFNLLVLFVERPRRVLSRDLILDLLKGAEWSPFDRSIDTLVARLRRKIEGDPDHPALVKTVRGVGYVFSADVGRR
ncbi:response regulator [Siculibacillus lacustris]|uniref:Regulatory protein VirG n=1 Tax=Siculibacillus lacustris TaxID=1549641 RepID=A0A4Q9VG62_9HYPH|nr:response regulator [Siculibacillus lacustris]TBW33869.1 response regulator [Siculibacillus lacustris]